MSLETTPSNEGSQGRRVVFVDGCRTPFHKANTEYRDLTSYDLARAALHGLLVKTGLAAREVERVVMGTVIQRTRTSNVARDAALAAGYPETTPAHTVTMACISSNAAIVDAMRAIQEGAVDVAVAGGTESLSDIPIVLHRRLRQRLMQAQQASSATDYLSLLQGLSASELVPETPEVAEYATGETMGLNGDKLAAQFGISREAQDAYALRSHQMAAQAHKKGYLTDEILPAVFPPEFALPRRDNTVRDDSSMEALHRLSPVFEKPHGTVTAGNASPLTDGASAVLLMSESKALELGFQPLATLQHATFVAQDPKHELLLGPAYAIPQLLDHTPYRLDDIDVFELHEAFAGQVLAVLTALLSERFARDHLHRTAPVGEIPFDSLNRWGGSLSLGHPFGATGARLVTTAARRLQHEDKERALVAACAAGGQGHAMMVERYG